MRARLGIGDAGAVLGEKGDAAAGCIGAGPPLDLSARTNCDMIGRVAGGTQDAGS
ncbi:hypothetical protein [Sphingomonas faeni]|uniref:hypothetical protein n=1 Tax=Sphingomonas faeni TaxID=185950 RepID=UPI0020C096D5|nr:hypothetical protein [Sphingomonas faeni]MCK8457921.1 hypothetical protein [Sphingomonas faeni]